MLSLNGDEEENEEQKGVVATTLTNIDDEDEEEEEDSYDELQQYPGSSTLGVIKHQDTVMELMKHKKKKDKQKWKKYLIYTFTAFFRSLSL